VVKKEVPVSILNYVTKHKREHSHQGSGRNNRNNHSRSSQGSPKDNKTASKNESESSNQPLKWQKMKK